MNLAQEFRNIIQREISRALKQLALPRIGTVDSYDPVKHAVKILHQDDSSLSGWMPVAQPWAGNGWGFHAAPVIGAQAVVNYHDGDHNSPFMAHHLYSLADAPINTPSGDFYIAHQSGCQIKLMPNGTIQISGTTVNILSPANEIGVSGGTFQTVVIQPFMALYNEHTHGGGPVPDQQMVASVHLSTNTKVT